jgi:hypothetical protein
MTSVATIAAVQDPRLNARIVRCEALVYEGGSAPELDRPPHVRAASGVVRAGSDLYIVQDDASFFAVRRADGSVSAIPLDAAPSGRRRFEVALGNKMDKLDLEVCVLAGDRVLGLGSGSHANRERIASLDPSRAEAKLHDASALYGALRRATEFSGSELNIEGAIAGLGVLRLFQRGNGAARDGAAAVNATVDLDLAGFLRWLDSEGELPPLRDIRRYDLGHERGVAYGFTDATLLGARVLYAAGAEDSPDVIEDGEVLGARIGVIEGGEARWTALLEQDGTPSTRKVEGIALAGEGHEKLFAVVDADDPEQPALLCEVVLDGPW